jgi:hypothetical protein
MKELSLIQKNRRTKILLSDDDWEEEIRVSELDRMQMEKWDLSIRELSRISRNAMERLSTVNDWWTEGNRKIYIDWLLF